MTRVESNPLQWSMIHVPWGCLVTPQRYGEAASVISSNPRQTCKSSASSCWRNKKASATHGRAAMTIHEVVFCCVTFPGFGYNLRIATTWASQDQRKASPIDDVECRPHVQEHVLALKMSLFSEFHLTTTWRTLDRRSQQTWQNTDTHSLQYISKAGHIKLSIWAHFGTRRNVRKSAPKVELCWRKSFCLYNFNTQPFWTH
jgi:hypothetical protein